MTLLDFIRGDVDMQRGYLPLLKALQPLPTYVRWHWNGRRRHGVDSITKLSFGDVNTIKRCLMSGEVVELIRAVELVYRDCALRMPVVRFYRCLRFLTLEVERIIKIENRHYHVEDVGQAHRLRAAGVEGLDVFGDLPVIDALAGGDMLRYASIEDLPYIDVHYVLWYRAMQQNIQNRYYKMSEQ